MVKKIKKFTFLLLLIIPILIFYSPFFVSFRLPVPLDTIVGLYNPYRDFYSNNYPNGIPFKNFLITDPVRQAYVWKELAIDQWLQGNIPIWNPYEMAGKPLLANFQSSVFYPLNLLLFIKPFYVSWSVFIFSQSLLTGFFMYLYLLNLKLKKHAAVSGALILCFSGFSISWLEWGNIGHTALWLPLILFSIDRIFISRKKTIFFILLIFSLISSFFGGHLQTFFYICLISICYLMLRWFQHGRNIKILVGFIVSGAVFLLVTLPQTLPTLKFISLSSRSIDRDYRIIEGWFIPWKHLIQYISPDFFGNPSTLNYWGTWNYGELVGYIGVLPLIIVLYSLFKKRRELVFYWGVVLVGLMFSLPTGISSLPFALSIPFVSSAQPTRLLFAITFSLVVLVAFGVDYLSERRKISFKILLPILFVGLFFIFLWSTVLFRLQILFPRPENLIISKRNLIFPSILFIVSLVYLCILSIVKKEKFRQILFILGILIIGFDLVRFAQKFTPFVTANYVFPQTKIINFIQSQSGIFRVANLDRRIMPPNFFTHYKIQSIEGYDPLYLQNYAEYITALERDKSDIAPPFGFSRIITPHNYNSQLFDLLNVRYILSLDEVRSKKLVKIMEEGQTKLYINKESFDRAFFVKSVKAVSNDIQSLFSSNLKETAVVLATQTVSETDLGIGRASIIYYKENEINIATENNSRGFLVLTDVYYPTWHAFIDGIETKIYLTDHAFRGVFVPSGIHTIIFKDTLF